MLFPVAVAVGRTGACDHAGELLPTSLSGRTDRQLSPGQQIRTKERRHISRARPDLSLSRKLLLQSFDVRILGQLAGRRGGVKLAEDAREGLGVGLVEAHGQDGEARGRGEAV